MKLWIINIILWCSVGFNLTTGIINIRNLRKDTKRFKERIKVLDNLIVRAEENSDNTSRLMNSAVDERIKRIH